MVISPLLSTKRQQLNIGIPSIKIRRYVPGFSPFQWLRLCPFVIVWLNSKLVLFLRKTQPLPMPSCREFQLVQTLWQLQKRRKIKFLTTNTINNTTFHFGHTVQLTLNIFSHHLLFGPFSNLNIYKLFVISVISVGPMGICGKERRLY